MSTSYSMLEMSSPGAVETHLMTSKNVSSGLVSDEVTVIFQVINVAIICQIIDVLGTGTNIINIICFVKLGFKDPVNVSLLGLAISDLGCLVTLVWMAICFNPLFHQIDLPFEPMEIQYLTGGWTHVIFTRVTSCITAFITFERCLCITMPLKVRSIITPRRVTIIIVVLFTILICSVSPVYYANGFGWKFSLQRNRTVLGLVFTSDRIYVEKITIAINNVFVPGGAFITVIVCTTILVVSLKRKSKWREKSSLSVQGQIANTRDQKVTKMILVISSVFIACFVPVCILVVANICEPELSIDGKYRNMFIILFTFAFLLESTNSAMNIFIYYQMSSKYRATFRQLFRLKRELSELSES